VRSTVARRLAAAAAALVFLLAARQVRGQGFEGIQLVPEQPTTHDRIEVTVASAHGSAWFSLETFDPGRFVIHASDQQIIGVPLLDGPSKTFALGPLAAGTYTIELNLSVSGYLQSYERSLTVTPPDPTLALHGGRFKVRVDWTNPYGPGQGQGFAESLSEESGAFWFFDPANIEVTIKVLDGRPVNGHFWVFIANMSTVEFTVTVEDCPPDGLPLPCTPRSYRNPPFANQNFIDTRAFAQPLP
jgi:hypothetical protein